MPKRIKKSKLRKKVLLVDDELDDLLIMKEILEKHNFEVTALANGRKALEAINSDKYHLLLLDILMPELSGYDLLRLFRKKQREKIPLVFVSIIPENEVDKTNIDGFIQKPFSPEKFINVIQKALK